MFPVPSSSSSSSSAAIATTPTNLPISSQKDSVLTRIWNCFRSFLSACIRFITSCFSRSSQASNQQTATLTLTRISSLSPSEPSLRSQQPVPASSQVSIPLVETMRRDLTEGLIKMSEAGLSRARDFSPNPICKAVVLIRSGDQLIKQYPGELSAATLEEFIARAVEGISTDLATRVRFEGLLCLSTPAQYYSLVTIRRPNPGSLAHIERMDAESELMLKGLKEELLALGIARNVKRSSLIKFLMPESEEARRQYVNSLVLGDG